MNIQAYVFSKNGWINEHLAHFLWEHETPWRAVPGNWGGIAARRNWAVHDFMRKDKEYAAFFDGDVTPGGEGGLSPILVQRPEVELVYMGWAIPFSGGHYGDGQLSLSCCRIKKEVFQAIAEPWFTVPLNEDYSPASCDCRAFRDRVFQKGYTPVMLGIAGHLREQIFVPGEDGQYGMYQPPKS